MRLKQNDRYNSDQLTEGLFEPGSRNRVYKNLLGIRKKREMDQVEYEELIDKSQILFDSFDENHKFKANHIRKIHKTWLGSIYSWAGEYRQVNLSKGGFHFAAADQIPKLMKQLEQNELHKLTPCNFTSLHKIAEAIAIIHAELILIHPFREGNGRLARMIANLMALQARLPLLSFNELKGEKRQKYFSAIRSGLTRDYQPIIEIFSKIISSSVKKTNS